MRAAYMISIAVERKREIQLFTGLVVYVDGEEEGAFNEWNHDGSPSNCVALI
jgi:hypothetical protein